MRMISLERVVEGWDLILDFCTKVDGHEWVRGLDSAPALASQRGGSGGSSKGQHHRPPREFHKVLSCSSRLNDRGTEDSLILYKGVMGCLL